MKIIGLFIIGSIYCSLRLQRRPLGSNHICRRIKGLCRQLAAIKGPAIIIEGWHEGISQITKPRLDRQSAATSEIALRGRRHRRELKHRDYFCSYGTCEDHEVIQKLLHARLCSGHRHFHKQCLFSFLTVLGNAQISGSQREQVFVEIYDSVSMLASGFN